MRTRAHPVSSVRFYLDVSSVRYRLILMTPNLKIETTEHGTWVECSCGAGEYAPKQLLHRRRCSDKSAQYDASAPATPVAAASDKSDAEIKAFAASVRRTGLTLGRDEDVLEAVRRGHLSVGDAMNTDD